MKFTEVGEMITENYIQELETKINLLFSTQYKNFLLQNNGGMPEDDVEFTFTEIDPETNEKYKQGSDIHYFYNTDEMMNAYENLICEKLIQDDYLPIACDSFGNQILLYLGSGKENGAVYFSNHEVVNPNDTFWVASKVADSFNEFIDKLHIIEY